MYFCKWQKADEKTKEDEQNLEEKFSSSPFPNKMSVSINQLHKRIELFLFLPYNKRLINQAKSVCMGES